MSSEQLVYTPDPEVLWKPAQDTLHDTSICKFMAKVRAKYHVKLDTYDDLYNWSVENYSEFWEEAWEYLGVIYSKGYDFVVDKTKNISDIPQWFQGSRLNFAENLLRCQDDKVAIYAAVEGYKNVGDLRKKTFKEMREDVRRFAAAMKSFGVKEGDRVVGYLPNSIEAVEAMLAAASIGAIWSSCSPEFGVSAVLERFSQIQPKIIFSVDGVVYNGKKHDQMEKLQQIIKGLPDLLCVVVVPYLSESPDLRGIPNSCVKEDFLKRGLLPDGSCPPLEFKQLPFNHPLFIMYSSGTTGTPKCMVHSAGGTLLKHLEEHILQGNLKKNDVMMYFTTTGWMMWNWSVSSLAVGSTLVCYDGSPLAPDVDTLWNLMSDLKVTVLGTGAKWLSVVEENRLGPKPTHDLSHLHTILSTGSPLKPQSFSYVYEAIKKEVVLGSITGGTDIIACFAGITRILPVRKGEIQCRYLGMAVESWDEEGKSVIGESGELVCTKPFPSMPIYFLNDPDGKKYRAAYFDKFDGVWAHGDFCIINSQTGGIWMLGRSDGTLNPGGVRFGSAEIYHVVESFKEISDSLCVGQKSSDGMDERVVLFLKMASGVEFTPELVKQVQQSIRKQLSPRHVPPVVLETPDIPYTHSGKKVEIAVKRIISGEKVKPSGALANPQSLDFYRDLQRLKGY